MQCYRARAESLLRAADYEAALDKENERPVSPSRRRLNLQQLKSSSASGQSTGAPLLDPAGSDAALSGSMQSPAAIYQPTAVPTGKAVGCRLPLTYARNHTCLSQPC